MSAQTDPSIINLLSWTFNTRLDDLIRAYKEARSTPEIEKKSIENRWEEFEKEVKAGNASYIAEDDEGNSFDYGEYVGEMLHEVQSSLGVMQEAFVIMLHHFVEKELNIFMRTKQYDFNKAYRFLRENGLQVDEDRLELLRLAANVAKHSAGSSADQLYKKRPDLFDQWKLDNWKISPSHNTLKLTDEFVLDMFNGVKKSITK